MELASAGGSAWRFNEEDFLWSLLLYYPKTYKHVRLTPSIHRTPVFTLEHLPYLIAQIFQNIRWMSQNRLKARLRGIYFNIFNWSIFRFKSLVNPPQHILDIGNFLGNPLVTSNPAISAAVCSNLYLFFFVVWMCIPLRHGFVSIVFQYYNVLYIPWCGRRE